MKQTAGGKTIVLSGDISIQNIEKYTAEIIDALKKNDTVSVKGENITGFDLSAVQLIFAAKKQAEKDNKRFNINIKLPVDLMKIMSNVGFEELFVK